MNIETAIVAALVLAAAAFVVARAWRAFRPGHGNCGCGDKRGCARMHDALRAAGAQRR